MFYDNILFSSIKFTTNTDEEKVEPTMFTKRAVGPLTARYIWPTKVISGHRCQTARITPNNQPIGAFRPLFILRWDSSVDTALTAKAHIVAVIGGQHNSLGVPHNKRT